MINTNAARWVVWRSVKTSQRQFTSSGAAGGRIRFQNKPKLHHQWERRFALRCCEKLTLISWSLSLSRLWCKPMASGIREWQPPHPIAFAFKFCRAGSDECGVFHPAPSTDFEHWLRHYVGLSIMAMTPGRARYSQIPVAVSQSMEKKRIPWARECCPEEKSSALRRGQSFCVRLNMTQHTVLTLSFLLRYFSYTKPSRCWQEPFIYDRCISFSNRSIS